MINQTLDCLQFRLLDLRVCQHASVGRSLSLSVSPVSVFPCRAVAFVILCGRIRVLCAPVRRSSAGSIDNPVMDGCGKWFGISVRNDDDDDDDHTAIRRPLVQLPEQPKRTRCGAERWSGFDGGWRGKRCYPEHKFRLLIYYIGFKSTVGSAVRSSCPRI